MSKKKQSIQERYQQVIKLITFSEMVVRGSLMIPSHLKKSYLDEYQVNRADAEEYLDTRNSSFLKQLEEEVLTPWHETHDKDSQKFWALVEENGIDIEQKNYLFKILGRGRISNFKEYNIVQDSLVIWQQQGQITLEQTNQLGEMLSLFEKERSG